MYLRFSYRTVGAVFLQQKPQVVISDFNFVRQTLILHLEFPVIPRDQCPARQFLVRAERAYLILQRYSQLLPRLVIPNQVWQCVILIEFIVEQPPIRLGFNSFPAFPQHDRALLDLFTSFYSDTRAPMLQSIFHVLLDHSHLTLDRDPLRALFVFRCVIDSDLQIVTIVQSLLFQERVRNFFVRVQIVQQTDWLQRNRSIFRYYCRKQLYFFFKMCALLLKMKR